MQELTLWFANFNPQAITYTLLAIAVLLSCGFWLSALLQRERTLAEIWAAAPILGLMVLVLTTANLNYLGVPVKISAPALTALFGAGSLWVGWRMPARFGSGDPMLGWRSLGVALAAPLLFLAPYLINGGYYSFNDAVYYASIADFVREHSYFASTAAAPQYLWLSEMNLAQAVWGRMGAQYILATLSSLTGVDGAGVFLPVCAAGIFAGCCAFWIFARKLTRSALGSLLAVLFYAGNVTFVHYVGGLNFASQTLSLGGMYVLAALFIENLDNAGSRIMAAVVIAGMASIYPEIFPAAAVPVAVAAALLLARHILTRTVSEIGRQTLVAGARWAQILGMAFLLNPYTWVHLLPNVVKQYNATKTGFAFLPISWSLVEMYSGLCGPERSTTPTLHVVGVLMLAVAVFGVARLGRKTRWLVLVSAAVYTALALVQLYVRHFPYAALKVLVYSFYLVPAVLACGFATLLEHPSEGLRWCGRLLFAVWLGFAGRAFIRFAAGSYFPMVASGMSTATRWNSIAEVANLAHIAKTGEITLIGCRPDSLARWIPYFYRRPAGDLFPSVYYTFTSKAVTDPRPFAWYLFYRPDTSWADESAILFDNGLFTFSKPQTALLLTDDGWYGAEPFGVKYAHWMNKRGRLLMVAPHLDAVTLQSSVGLAPDKQPKHLRYFLDGAAAGGTFVDGNARRLETPRFNLSPGFHQLVFETEEESGPSSVDSRSLNLWFGDLRIAQPAHSK
jgi:hypothetical protein